MIHDTNNYELNNRGNRLFHNKLSFLLFEFFVIQNLFSIREKTGEVILEFCIS